MNINYNDDGTDVDLAWDSVAGSTGYRVSFESESASATVPSTAKWVLVEALGDARTEAETFWPTGGSLNMALEVGSAGTAVGGSGVALTTDPPGWNGGDVMDPASFPGFTVVNTFSQCTNDAVDYYVQPQNISVTADNPQGGGRTVAAQIPGGRHVVSFGGTIDVDPASVYDDAINLLIETGGANGVVHIEGYRFPRGANIVTIRSNRTIQLVYNRVDKCFIFENDHVTGGVHPDVVQCWDQGPPNVVVEYLVAGYSFTGLTNLLSPNPTTYSMDHVYVFALPLEPNSIKTVKGWDVAGGNVTYFGDEKVTDFSFNECWCIPGDEDGGATRRLQDVLTYGASAPASTVTGTGRAVGDTISWPTVPLLADGFWTLGTPEWDVPAASVGFGVYAGRS